MSDTQIVPKLGPKMESHSKDTMSWWFDPYFSKVAAGSMMPNRHGGHEEMGEEDRFEWKRW